MKLQTTFTLFMALVAVAAFQNCEQTAAKSGGKQIVQPAEVPPGSPPDPSGVIATAKIDDTYDDLPAQYVISFQQSGRASIRVEIFDEQTKMLATVLPGADGTRLHELFGRIYSYEGGDASCRELNMPGYAVFQTLKPGGGTISYTVGRRKSACEKFNELKSADKAELFRTLAEADWERAT